MSGGEVGSDAIFFLWDFCAVWCFSYRACAIMYAVAMGTSEWEAFVPRSHMPHLLIGGVVRLLLLLLIRRPRSCSILVVPLFLIAPPVRYDRRGDFLPWLGHSIFELAITARFVSPYPRRSHLPVWASCGFWGFHMGPSPRACLPAPPCLIRLALTRHASRDVIIPIAPLIVSPYGSSSPLAPSFRHDERGGVIAWSCGAFHVRTMRYNPPSFSFHYSSSRLLSARRPMPINTVGVSVYRLGYQSAPPFRSHSPRPIDTGNGENDGEAYPRA